MAKRLLRVAGYGLFSLLALLVGVYLTFPGDAVGQRLAHELRERTGGQVTATFGSVSLYRLTGIEAENVRLLVGLTDPPTPVNLDAVRGRLQILPLCWLALSFSAGVELRDGSVAADVTPDDDGVLAAEVEIDSLNLATPPLLSSVLGLPVTGVVDGHADFQWSQDPRRSKGEATMSLQQLTVGPGDLVKGFSLPNQINFGQLEMDLTLDGGQVDVRRFAQSNGGKKPDIEIRQASIETNLRRTLSTTSYDACIALKLDEAFLEKNKKFEAVMDLATIPAPVGPGFRKDEDGFLHASFSGTLAGSPKPRRRLCSEKEDVKPDRDKGPKGRPPKTQE